MKVSLTLKKIIEAKVQPRSYVETKPLIDRACMEVVKAHKMTAKVARLRKLRKEVTELQNELHEVGVQVETNYLCVGMSGLFRAAGGVYPSEGGSAAVISQLAAATPEEGRAILKSHGIDWS